MTKVDPREGFRCRECGIYTTDLWAMLLHYSDTGHGEMMLMHKRANTRRCERCGMIYIDMMESRYYHDHKLCRKIDYHKARREKK